jgi:hypothetical protein
VLIKMTESATELYRAEPLVGEVSTNFCGWRVPCGQRDGSLRPYSHFLDQNSVLITVKKLNMIHWKIAKLVSTHECTRDYMFPQCRC